MHPKIIDSNLKIERPEAPNPVLQQLFRKDHNATAVAVFPLAQQIIDLIQPLQIAGNADIENPRGLAAAVLSLLQRSEKLWEKPHFTAVFKCAPDIVAKVVTGTVKSVEYSSMQYLSENAPSIPAPRPYGLIRMTYGSIVFMSYIPGTTLQAACPALDHGQKLDVRGQLQAIFTRLRQIIQPDGMPLGGVHGEGVNDSHRWSNWSTKPIYTVDEFEDFKFSLLAT